MWIVKLNGSVGAVPITYQGADGQHYVVANATGVYGSPATSDRIVAFTVK